MIAEEDDDGVIHNAVFVQRPHVLHHLLVHGGRHREVIVAECVGPEHAKKGAISVDPGELDGQVVYVLGRGLASQAVGQVTLDRHLQLLLHSQDQRSAVHVRRRMKETPAGIVEGGVGAPVLGEASCVALRLELPPNEWAGVQATHLVRLALFIGVGFVESRENRHQIWKGVVAHLR